MISHVTGLHNDVTLSRIHNVYYIKIKSKYYNNLFGNMNQNIFNMYYIEIKSKYYNNIFII